MKRDPQSPANFDGDSALDNYQSVAETLLDDATLDETPWLPPPMDIDIRGASPVDSCDDCLQAFNATTTSSAMSPICGAGPIRGAASFDVGAGVGPSPSSQWSAGMAAPPTLLKTESKPAAEDSPTSALERRRQKNREFMRRSRQKQRDELRDMKAAVTALEKQYAELSLRSSERLETMGAGGALTTRGRMASDYTQAVESARRLAAENLYLKAEIQQQTAWKVHLSQLLQSRVEVDGPRWAQQFQQPALGGEEILRMQLDKLDEFAAFEEFGYHKLSDLDLTHLILENRRTIARVQSNLLVPSSFDWEDGARTRRMQAFGWEMVQRVHGNIMECVFTKKFQGLDVARLMQKTWANDMRLGEFKKVKGETCRLEVLQQINPNAYVLCRDVMSPTDDIATFRSVYVRFLIETNQKIPFSRESSTTSGIDASAPLTPPLYDSDSDELMLDATGYVLGTQSVATDYALHPRAADVFSKVAWAHISLSIEFLNVVNPVTGEAYQQLCWTGRTNYCGEEHAKRNASDMMQGMLRWELLVISPAVHLASLSLAE